MSPPQDEVLNTSIARFELADQTIFDGLAKLSSEPMQLAFGFESVLKPKFADPPIPDPHFDLLLEHKTVRQVLDALCSLDGRYTWSHEKSTINVYPLAIVGDHAYLLNRKLDKLEIKSVTEIDQALLAIARQLPPPEEQIAVAQIGGDLSFPSEGWSARFENLTVREAINRIAGHMGPRGSWTFFGSHEFRAFSFHRTAFEHMKSE